MGARVTTLKNITVTYNGFNLTPYLNTASLENTVEVIDTTTFDSDGKENAPGAPGFSVNIGGPWTKTLDDALAPDAAIPPTTLRTLVYSMGPTGAKAIRTWTGTETVGAFISNYTIDASDPMGNLAWSGELTVSGVPVRTTG
jgi:hypothetical protein